MNKNYQGDEFLRKRQERQRKIRKRRAKIIGIFFLILLLVVGAVLSVTVLFPIKNIASKGSKVYSEAEIIENCDINIGDNLIALSKSKSLNKLKAKLPFVENIEFERNFPDTLILKITDAKEYVCYKVDKNYYSVSKNGWVLKSYTQKPKGIMLIISENVNCKVGSELNFSDVSVKETYLIVEEALSTCKLSIDYVDISDKISIKAKVDGRFIVDFGSSKNLEQKLKHLNAMIKEIGETVTGKIDLSMWSSQNTQGAFVETKIK